MNHPGVEMHDFDGVNLFKIPKPDTVLTAKRGTFTFTFEGFPLRINYRVKEKDKVVMLSGFSEHVYWRLDERWKIDGPITIQSLIACITGDNNPDPYAKNGKIHSLRFKVAEAKRHGKKFL